MRMALIVFSILFAGRVVAADDVAPVPAATDIAVIGTGWQGVVVARVDQSYAGWDVEIADADNDGKNEILTTGCPDSRLYLFKNDGPKWKTTMLADNLAEDRPAMGLTVSVADLNGDGTNEVLLGTGQEKGGTAWFHVLSTDGKTLTNKLSCRPECNKSSFTHNFAIYDLNRDGLKEVISAYCGGGEVIRYDTNKTLTAISARKIHQLSGSGEESIIADVDNDGKVEYLTANGFRPGKARVEIFDIDDKGELSPEPRIAIAGYEDKGCFYASFIVGDVNNDGKNELVISTRGDNVSEFITSSHLGRAYIYRVGADGKSSRETLVDFREEDAESSWLAVGDCDNDGMNEIVLATGKGDRTKPGVSYVVLLEKLGGVPQK